MDFEEVVIPRELQYIRERRASVYGEQGQLAEVQWPEKGLVGLALSGGGIRSATFNLGILQGLHRLGVFRHVDYLSTVSGGGFIGASLSYLMRNTSLSYLKWNNERSTFPFDGDN